jgi:hypothetical protein
MIDILLLSIGILGLLIGSYTDFKTREVPDWINYAMIASGLGLRLAYSVFSNEWSYFLYGLLGFGLFFGIACAMFYTGQWGGGDSKMLMGLGALFGTYPEILLNIFSPKVYVSWMPDFMGIMADSLGFLIAFLINALFVGAVYGMIWSIVLSIKHRKEFAKEIKQKLSDKKMTLIRRIVMIICIILLVSAFFIKMPEFQLLVIVVVFLSMLTIFTWIYVKSIEAVCMYKTVSAEKLTEGDWIAEDVMLDGKKVYDANKLGIEKKDIEKLIKLNVKKVVVKEGIPFVPSFFISLIVTLMVGNLLLFFGKF